MKIAFTHNLKLTEAEEEAEFDTVETVDAIANALAAGGHEVEKIEVSGPASHLAARIEAFAPDLIFNTAEGRRGRAREAFYPALFEELNYPYTGSDAYVLTVTLDKWLTKCVVKEQGIDTPRARLVTARDLPSLEKLEGSLGVGVPAIVKPNYEGSSKGIGDDSVARDWRSLRALVEKTVKQYPAGVLIEEFIPGVDVTVPFVEGLGDEGVMMPVEYVIEAGARSKFNIYDYRLKNTAPEKVNVRCPAELPRDVLARLKAISKTAVRLLGMRDVGRIDFRLGDDGRIYFLEVNALPSLEPGASIFAASKREEGLSYVDTILQVVKSAGVRWGLQRAEAPKKKQSDKLRIGFTYNMKRVDSKAGNDTEAEYDGPETIDAIRTAIESLGYEVVPLEATSELPQRLADAKVDIVFNIAEGLSGRNREAQVPALCELIGIPYTGSDSATLALALDKALAKRILRQHGILTPEFQVFASGREKLHPTLLQKFPLIVKPNAEGSSKGISGSGVVDDEAGLRAAVTAIVEKYRQPALVEEYISGREFTVGLLGDKRPRILPPMEICFKDASKQRPVYDFEIKQEWEKHVYYECPAKLSPAELKTVERAARDTFMALDCRDVARIDLRMGKDGQVYVLEVNPLPGLTPDYSDLVLISTAAGITYRTLIGEILAGALKRLREKKREALPRPVDRERTDRVEKVDPIKPEAIS
ncbi:MAG: D-alanine--D-alanine ligase [Myxococcales bacterium]|nr:D-alanine--D-alanine ligase [Myxococcales bacterium]